jgi:hypothetical protein
MRNLSIVLVCGLCVLMRCSCGMQNVAGSSTETDTGSTVEGIMVFSNGSTVKGADVKLRDQAKMLRLTVGMAKRAATIRRSDTTTDVNGFFAFDSVDTGSYYVLVNYKDSVGGLFTATVPVFDTTVEVNGSLGLMGQCIGSLDSSLVSKTQQTYVYIVQADTLVPVNADGSFNLGGLPPGTYTIRIVYGDAFQKTPVDTMEIPIQPGDTTKLPDLGGLNGTVIINGSIFE